MKELNTERLGNFLSITQLMNGEPGNNVNIWSANYVASKIHEVPPTGYSQEACIM